MLRQIEGSRAVAETVALCRPRGHLRLPDLARRRTSSRALSALVKDRRARALRVRQRRVRVRRDVGRDRRLGHRRAHLHGDGEPGPALHGRGALQRRPASGLPIVMTVANRAIGAPINIWNDHTDSMSQRDSRLDPALRRDQPGGARPPRPGLPARRGALAAGDGLHGRLHPHPRLRARRRARPRSRSTPSCRRSSRARCSTPTSRSRSARWSGPRRSPRCATSRTPSRCRRSTLIPEIAGEFEAAFGRDSGGLRARATAPRTPRPSSSRSARCSARSRTPSTSCATRASRRRARHHARSGRSRWTSVRAALGRRRAGRRAREGARRRHRRHRRRRRAAWRSPGSGVDGPRRHRRPRRAADHAGLAAPAARRRASPTGWTPLTFLDLDRDAGRARARAHARAAHARARTPRTCCATSASSPRGRSDERREHAQVLPGRQLRGRQPAARPGPALRAGRPRARRTRSPRGHRACQGCGEALGARYVARRRDARHRAASSIAANATGCLEVFSTPVPRDLVAAAVAALAVRQRARRSPPASPRR